MAYNDAFTKMVGDTSATFKTEITAVQDNVTSEISAPILEGGKYKAKGDLNEIIQEIINNDVLLKAIADKLRVDLDGHANNKNNPHTTTKGQIGLGNVENYTVTSSVSDASNTKYATAGAVKTVQDNANGRVSKSGDSMNSHLEIIDGTKNEPSLILHNSFSRKKITLGIYDPFDIKITESDGSNSKRFYTEHFKPTNADVGLSNVQNWTATGAVDDPSDSKYATAGAVKKAYDKGTEALNVANANTNAINASTRFYPADTTETTLYIKLCRLPLGATSTLLGFSCLVNGAVSGGASQDNHFAITITTRNLTTASPVSDFYPRMRIKELNGQSVVGVTLVGVKDGSHINFFLKRQVYSKVTTISNISITGGVLGELNKVYTAQEIGLPFVEVAVDCCPYKVGDIVITKNGISPANSYPRTSWERYGIGRMLVHADGGRYKENSTGGLYETTLTVDQIPSHNHISNYVGTTSTHGGHYPTGQGQGQPFYSSSTGGGKSFANESPYITAFMWVMTGTDY